MHVGTMVKLKVPCLRNEPGTRGVCYDQYQMEKDLGYSVIFENGEYDGFSQDEASEMLEIVGVELALIDYIFTNVMKLTEDFRKGVFDCVLREGKDRNLPPRTFMRKLVEHPKCLSGNTYYLDILFLSASVLSECETKYTTRLAKELRQLHSRIAKLI